MDLEMYQEYFQQGEVLLSAGNYEVALSTLKKAAEIDPNHADLYVDMGIALVNLDQLDEAEKIFKKALYVDKKCGEAYFHIGCVQGLKGDFASAIANIDTARVNGYDNSQLYYTLGMMYEEQGDTNMALRNYNKALSIDQTRPDIHLQKCNLLITENRLQDAIEAADSMIKCCPDYFEGYHLKSSLCCDLNKFDEAEQTLNNGIEMFPDEVGFKVDKSRVLISQKKYDDAQKLLTELEPIADEWKREVIMEEVRLAGLQEKPDETLNLLEKAYSEFSSAEKPDEEICYLLMSVCQTLKKHDRVIKVAQDLIKVSNNKTYVNIAYFYSALSQKELGNTEVANEAFRDTVKHCRATALADPAALDAYMIRALSLNQLGENDAALEMIDYVMALAPDSAEVHSAKAVILKSMDRIDEMNKEVEIVNSKGGALGNIVSAL